MDTTDSFKMGLAVYLIVIITILFENDSFDSACEQSFLLFYYIKILMGKLVSFC